MPAAPDYLAALWRQSWGQFDRRPIYQWAAEEGELPPSYAVTGRFDPSTAPMVKGPLDALRDRTVRHVVSMAGVQCLKTLLGELWLLWSIQNDPGPAQWLQTTDEDAEEHCKERYMSLLQAFPVIGRLFTANRHDITYRFMKFQHMYLRMDGVATRGNLQRKSIKLQMRSEIWQSKYWTPGTLKEANTRVTQFVHNSKRYTESQPGDDAELQTDDMHAAFLEGDQNVWNFPCQSCGKFQPYLWSHTRADGTRAAMRWEVSERTRRPGGAWRESELVQTIRYECIYCGSAHADEPLTRRRLTAAGKYVPQNLDAGPSTKSFTWNQLAMPQLSWTKHEGGGGVLNFLAAHAQAKKGFDRPLKEFFQKVLAEPYNPARHGLFQTLETIQLRSDPSDKSDPSDHSLVHEGITYTHRLMAVDVQADHFWLLIEIWSPAGDSLTLHAEKVFTWEDLRARQTQFHVPDENVSVDVSHRTHEVIIECSRSGHWVSDTRGRKHWFCWNALRGSDQAYFVWKPKTGPMANKSLQLPYTWPPPPGDPCSGLPMRDPRRAEFAGKYCWIYTWSNPTIKDVVIRRRDGKADAIKNLCVQGEWNDEYSRQLHSQKKIYVRGNFGPGKWKWEAFKDDHLFDCKCMITVKAFMLHLLGPGPQPAEPTGSNQ